MLRLRLKSDGTMNSSAVMVFPVASIFVSMLMTEEFALPIVIVPWVPPVIAPQAIVIEPAVPLAPAEAPDVMKTTPPVPVPVAAPPIRFAAPPVASPTDIYAS